MKFSILMATRNRPQFIPTAVAAVINQTHQDWELIVNDGGISIEHLLPVDQRVLYMRDNNNIPHALNAAMKLATGDVFVAANDDDVLLADTLEFVASEMVEELIRWPWLYGKLQIGAHVHGGPCTFAELLQGNRVPQPSTFWTRKVARDIGGFDESFLYAHDYDYWLRLRKRYEPKFVDRILAVYGLHSDQLTATHAREQDADAAAVRRKHGGA